MTNTSFFPSTERGETPIVYDTKQSRIVMFGGWANRWYGDLYVCKVGDVVGPPYSITSISPIMGPITGQTTCTISGTEGFLTHSFLTHTFLFAKNLNLYFYSHLPLSSMNIIVLLASLSRIFV